MGWIKETQHAARQTNKQTDKPVPIPLVHSARDILFISVENGRLQNARIHRGSNGTDTLKNEINQRRMICQWRMFAFNCIHDVDILCIAGGPYVLSRWTSDVQ